MIFIESETIELKSSVVAGLCKEEGSYDAAKNRLSRLPSFF